MERADKRKEREAQPPPPPVQPNREEPIPPAETCRVCLPTLRAMCVGLPNVGRIYMRFPTGQYLTTNQPIAECPTRIDAIDEGFQRLAVAMREGRRIRG